MGETVSEEFIGPLPNRGGINDRGGPRVFVLRSGGDEAQVQSHTEEPSLGDFYGAAVEGEMRWLRPRDDHALILATDKASEKRFAQD